MPSRARWWARRPLTSSPSTRTFPVVGSWRPVTTLNRVVFPAPLGPMSPVTRPGSAVRSTSWRAMTPPKRTLTSSTDRSDNAFHLPRDLHPSGRPRRRPAPKALEQARHLGHDAVRAAGDGHRPEAGAEEGEVLDRCDVALNDGKHRQRHAADEGAADSGDAADGRHQQDHQALMVDEVVGPDAPPQAPEQGAAQAGHGGRQGEDADLGAREVEPEGGARGRAVLH